MSLSLKYTAFSYSFTTLISRSVSSAASIPTPILPFSNFTELSSISSFQFGTKTLMQYPCILPVILLNYSTISLQRVALRPFLSPFPYLVVCTFATVELYSNWFLDIAVSVWKVLERVEECRQREIETVEWGTFSRR